MKYKIIILARAGDSSNIVYHYLTRHFDIEKVIFEKPFPKTKQYRNRIRKIGFWKTAGQVLFILLIVPFIAAFSGKRKKEILKTFDLDTTPVPGEASLGVPSVNSDACRQLLKEINPDLIIVNGTRIISQQTLDAVDAPFINIHTGITPLFRGVHGGYWAMATGNKDLFGATIHFVDKGVDTGAIIEQVFIEPGKKDNYFTYPYLQYAHCLPVLAGIIKKKMAGDNIPVKEPVTSDSALWYHPSIFEWIKNMKRTMVLLLLMQQ